MDKRPDCIKHFSEIQEKDEATYPGSKELLSIGSAFAKSFGLKKLGIHHELLPPGRRTSWPHAESDEEEFAYVIEGRPHVWIDGHLHQLEAGDGVGFPAGTGIAHTFINNTSENVRLLVVGEATKKENKCFYALHPQRNREIGSLLWTNPPQRALGPHDGLPDAQREIKIRLATPEDHQDILDVRARSILELCAKDYSDEQLKAWAYSDYREHGRELSDTPGFTWVVSIGARLEGLGQLMVDGEVRLMYVTSALKGQGYGKKLMTLMEAKARELGLSSLHLRSSKTALAFYKSQGFQRTSEEKLACIQGIEIPCIEMEKKL